MLTQKALMEINMLERWEIEKAQKQRKEKEEAAQRSLNEFL